MASPTLEMMQMIAIVAEQAADCIMQYYQQEIAVNQKQDHSPVTEADLMADSMIRSRLAAISSWPIVSEEGEKPDISTSEFFWLVDPLDGTKSFIRKKGDFTVNIGLIHKGEPVMGAIVQPVTKDSYCGLKGGGAFYRRADGDWKKISVRAQQPMNVLVSHAHYSPRTDEFLKKLPEHRTIPQSSSIKFCVIAAGEADCYPRFGETSEWDTAAGDAILRAAGGMTVDMQGKPFAYGKAGFRNSDFIAWGKAKV